MLSFAPVTYALSANLYFASKIWCLLTDRMLSRHKELTVDPASSVVAYCFSDSSSYSFYDT